MRSSMPPWPGRTRPESLTPAPRLIIDSTRSPTWAAAAVAPPTARSPGSSRPRRQTLHTAAATSAGHEARRRPLPALLRADHRRHLVPAPARADVVGRRVAQPDDGEQQEDQPGVGPLQVVEAGDGQRRSRGCRSRGCRGAAIDSSSGVRLSRTSVPSADREQRPPRPAGARLGEEPLARRRVSASARPSAASGTSTQQQPERRVRRPRRARSRTYSQAAPSMISSDDGDEEPGARQQEQRRQGERGRDGGGQESLHAAPRRARRLRPGAGRRRRGPPPSAAVTPP